MRIVNESTEVIPMYWWSNMAVPEYEQGHITVPASEAYAGTGVECRKVSLPEVDGVDVSDYQKIHGVLIISLISRKTSRNIL